MLANLVHVPPLMHLTLRVKFHRVSGVASTPSGHEQTLAAREERVKPQGLSSFRTGLRGLSLVMALLATFLLSTTAVAGAGYDAVWRPHSSLAEIHATLVAPAQYFSPSPPNVMQPRRPLPPRLRGYRPPNKASALPRKNRKISSKATQSKVRLSPSQALKRALRRWPGGIGLSVRLLRHSQPVYVVRIRAGSRVVQVKVDAMNGRIMQ